MDDMYKTSLMDYVCKVIVTRYHLKLVDVIMSTHLITIHVALQTLHFHAGQRKFTWY